jgi:hypothetical protein
MTLPTAAECTRCGTWAWWLDGNGLCDGCAELDELLAWAGD